MSYITGNPHEDAQDYIRSLDNSPASLFEPVSCDLCDYEDERLDMIAAPDNLGYYCPSCYKSGDVESYLRRWADLSEQELETYFKTIKIS